MFVGSSRISDGGSRPQAVPRPHGRVSGHPYTRGRRGETQVSRNETRRCCKVWRSQRVTFLRSLCCRTAHYEGGAVCSQARSLWRLEPLRIRWRHENRISAMIGCLSLRETWRQCDLVTHPAYLWQGYISGGQKKLYHNIFYLNTFIKISQTIFLGFSFGEIWLNKCVTSKQLF